MIYQVPWKPVKLLTTMEFVNKAVEKGKAEAQAVMITPEARVPVLYGGDEIIMRLGVTDTTRDGRRRLTTAQSMMNFGRHTGKSFEHVRAAHPGYAAWARKKRENGDNLLGSLREYVQYCDAADAAAGKSGGAIEHSTKPCRAFVASGSCPYVNRGCRFAHNEMGTNVTRMHPNRPYGAPFRATVVYIKNQRAKVTNGAAFYDIDLPSALIVGVPCMGARRLDLMVRCPRPTTTAVTTVDGRHLCAECGTVDAIYAAHIKDIREYLEGSAPEGYSAF